MPPYSDCGALYRHLVENYKESFVAVFSAPTLIRYRGALDRRARKDIRPTFDVGRGLQEFRGERQYIKFRITKRKGDQGDG